MTTLFRPGFITAVFVPMGGDPADVATTRTYLTRWWDAARQLGMTDELLDGVPTALPTLPNIDEPDFRLLAGLSHIDDDGVRQAYLFARHDAIAACVAIASSGRAEPWKRWADLAAEWTAALGEAAAPTSVLGESRVFLGHVDLPEAELAKLGDAVSRALRAAGADAWEPPYLTADGATLWWWRDPDQRRVVTVIAPPDKEEALSRWIWWRDEREAADFMLYLLNAAKLDYETRVHAARRQAMTTSLRAIDRGLDDVLALHGRLAGSGRTTMPGLAAAQERLIGAQTASSSVVIELTYLQALRRTIGIARRNLGALAPVEASGGQPVADSMFRRDQDLARWLEEQIDQDLGYADAVVARSREAQGLTMLRLQQVSTQIARAQGRVTLMQTSLIGAMVASVGATTLLHITVDPADAIRLPLLLCFVSLLLAAPVLAAHWFERYGPIDKLAASVLGGSIGWLVVGLIAGDLPWLLIALAVVVGAAAAQAPVLWHDRRVVPLTAGG